MGILFSRNTSPVQQSAPQEELLTSAAEIVARQREAEQQRERTQHQEQQQSESQASGSRSPTANRSELQRSAESSALASPIQDNSEQANRHSNRRNFDSLIDLIQELLEDGRIHVRVDTDGEHLNTFFAERRRQRTDDDDMSDEESTEGDETERSANGTRTPTARSRRSALVKFSGHPVATAPNASATDAWRPANPVLAESLHSLREEIYYRCALTPTKAAGEPLLRTLHRRELNVLGAWPVNRCCPFQKTCTSSARSPSTILPSVKVFLTNSFAPNRRKVIDRQRTKVFCCHYLPSGNEILTGSQDEVIRLYRREGWKQRYKLKASYEAPCVGWSILDLIVSPDGRHCVYSTWSDKLYQHALIGDCFEDSQWISLNVNSTANDGRFAFFSLRFNQDASEIIAGGSDRCLYVYDRERDTSVVRIVAHHDDVNAVCFSSTSPNLLFSAGDDGLCKAWDRRALGEDDRPVGVFAGHRDGIAFIDLKSDDRYILTNSKDQTIKLWDIRSFSSFEAQAETRRAVGRQTWDYRYEAAPWGIHRIRPLKEDGSVLTLRGHSVLHTLIRAHFSPPSTGSRYIYTGCALGQCVVFDVLSGEVDRVYSGHRSVVRDCTWHPFESEIITTSWDGETALWRYDERAKRSLNPDSHDDNTGDEDSSDENYRPISRKRFLVKRKTTDSAQSETKLVRI